MSDQPLAHASCLMPHAPRTKNASHSAGIERERVDVVHYHGIDFASFTAISRGTCRRVALERFDARVMAARYIELYGQLAR